MRKLLLCLAALLAGGTAAAQHQHGKPGAGAPEAFTAAPAFGPDGTLWLVRPMVDRIVVTHSRDLGKTFSQPVVVTPEPMNLDWGPDARARIVVDDKGNLVVTFGTFQDKNFNGRAYFARSTDNGASFTRPRPITADTTSQRFEVAGVDPSGRVFAAWLDKRNIAKARAAGRAYPGAALAYAWEDGGADFGNTAIALDNTCECCRLGLAFAGAGRPAVVVPQHLPGLGARPRGHHLPRREDTGTGSSRERRRLEDRGLPASWAQPRHRARWVLSRRLVHRWRRPQGRLLCPRRFRQRSLFRAAGLVEAGSPAGAAVSARERRRAASRVEGVRRHESRRCAGRFPTTAAGSGPRPAPSPTPRMPPTIRCSSPTVSASTCRGSPRSRATA